MKKYLRRFKTEAEYQAFINDEENFLLPNVSYVEDTTTSYFNDKEEVIPAIIYAKYNATAENMVLSLFPENIKSLKIDGNSIEMVTPQKEVKTINVLAANVNYNPDNGEVDMPQEYFISNMPFSISFNVANDTMASIEYNYIFAVMEEDGVMMAEAIDRDNWMNCGFTYNKDDNSITASPMMFMEMPDITSYSYILGNVDMEKGEATFFDTDIKMTTLTSNNLPSPYMFETEGIHDVEIELCDETSFGLMFTSTCIQEVNIPGTVSSASQMSFMQCSYLTSVTFNNGLKTINPYSLYYCPNLTTLVLPDTLEYISIFGCAVTGLTELVLPNSVKEIGMYAFYGNPFTKVTLNEGLEIIGDISFGACTSLTSITIPDSVTTIGNSAFSGCSNLASVTIGSGLTKIGDYAFDGCPHIEFNGNNASEDKRCIVINGKLIYCNTTGLISYNIPNSVTEIGDGTFRDCMALTSITIPNSVTTIGNKAFYQCSNLASVDLGNGVTSIGDYAFQSCGLTSITIPDSVTSIGDYAFYQCNNMQPITISEGVTSIGASAFGSCDSLTSITIPNSVTSIGEYAFYGCENLVEFNGKFATNDKLALIANNKLIAFAPGSNITTYTIPEGVTSIGDRVFYRCSKLTEITIPNSVTEIGESAFYRCESLTSINIPEGVTSIGDDAFYYCSKLTSIIIPDSVTSIGGRAFRECNGLTSITIPDSVTEIGEQAFYGCSRLTSIIIPEGVTSIGDATFCYCNGLTSIIIPNSVTEIGRNAFQYCISLTSFTIPNSVTSIGDYAFDGCKSLTEITIPNSVTEIGDSAFYNCTSLAEFNGKFATNDKLALIANNKLIAFVPASSVTTYTIPDSVTYIGWNAFRDCSKLTSIIIPEGVTRIGNEAFRDCTSLTEITIPSSITSIGYGAFEECESLTSVYCQPTTPPEANGSSIFNYNAEGRKIYVPMASVDAYKSAEFWSNYSSAIEGYNF